MWLERNPSVAGISDTPRTDSTSGLREPLVSEAAAIAGDKERGI